MVTGSSSAAVAGTGPESSSAARLLSIDSAGNSTSFSSSMGGSLEETVEPDRRGSSVSRRPMIGAGLWRGSPRFAYAANEEALRRVGKALGQMSQCETNRIRKADKGSW